MGAGIDLDTMEGKARLSKLAAPYINLIPDGVFKTLLFKALADRTNMDLDSLRRLREIEKDSSFNDEPVYAPSDADSAYGADDPEGPRQPLGARSRCRLLKGVWHA